MRTLDRGYFLFGIVGCLLSIFSFFSTCATAAEEPWGIWKCRICSESKCKKNPAIGADCVNHCAAHSGAGPECQKAASNAAGDGGKSDEKLIEGLKRKGIAAIGYELNSVQAGYLQIDKGENPEAIKAKIIKTITKTISQINSKYGGIKYKIKKRPLEVKALWDECTKLPPKNCRVYRDEALVRKLFCPASTRKECDKEFAGSAFPSAKIQIGIPEDSSSEASGDDGEATEE